MRQGQQNRRGRGRNRKSQSPLTRSFESTGPDVKLRGTPNHIAEKYMSLARDAHSSGDPVLAENYMQHAEHYNRIIMSFREQQISQGGGDPFAGGMGRPSSMGDGMDGDDFGDDEGDEFADNRGGMGSSMGGPQSSAGDMQSQAPSQSSNQPRSFDQPQRYDNRQHQHRRDQHRQHNNPRHDRGEGRGEGRFDRSDRGERQDFRGERNDRNGNGNGEPRSFREDRQPPPPNPADAAGEPPPQRRRERFQNGPGDAVPGQAAPHSQQPEFLRRPVRRPRAEPEEGATSAPRQPASDDQD